jgi:hypothetical protein
VCFVVICVPFCFIVTSMYVVALFSMLCYCLVGWYYLSYVRFLFCIVASYLFCSLLLYCMFVFLFFSPSSSYIVFVFSVLVY